MRPMSSSSLCASSAVTSARSPRVRCSSSSGSVMKSVMMTLARGIGVEVLAPDSVARHEGDFVNIAPLQLGEEFLQVHWRSLELTRLLYRPGQDCGNKCFETRITTQGIEIRIDLEEVAVG